MPKRKKSQSKILAEEQLKAIHASKYIQFVMEEAPGIVDPIHEFAMRMAGGKGLTPKYPAHLEELAFLVGEAQDADGNFIERGDADDRPEYDVEMLLSSGVNAVRRSLERSSDIEAEVPYTRVPTKQEKLLCQ